MKTEPHTFPNLLLISGTGRNTGKTTFACKLIRLWSGHGIYAIKMSSHFHPQTTLELMSEASGQFQVYRETVPSGQKDSARMLAAGATAVFYILTSHEFAFDAFRQIVPHLPASAPVVCESGGLGSYLSPGMHIVMARQQPLPGDKVIQYQPDLLVHMNGNGFSISPERLLFDECGWRLRT